MQLRKTLAFVAAAIAISAGTWIMCSQPRAVGRDGDTAQNTPEPRHERHARAAADQPGDQSKPDARRDKGDRPADKAKGDGKGDKPGHHRPSPEQIRAHITKVLFDNLKLTDDQNKKIQAIMDDGRKQRDAWVEDHRDEMHQLRTEMDQARKAKDKDKIKQVREKFRDLMKSSPKPDAVMGKVREVLDKDQQKRFDENLKKLRQEMRSHMHHHGPGDKDHHGPHPDKDHAKSKDKDKSRDAGASKSKDGDHPASATDGAGGDRKAGD